MKTQTFAIVGLGLLGGSLGCALQRAFPNSKVLGFSRSSSKIKLAKKKGLIHSGGTKLEEVVASADVIIICTPVDTIPRITKEIDRCAKKGAIVTDVGSTKASIDRWAAKQSFRNIAFVGSHPMAGSHQTGLEFAKKDLYRDAIVFVTRHPGIHPKALNIIKNFWKRLKCRVVVINSKQHDQIVAEISQFPHLLSALLVNLAANHSIRFASTGFRDTTRIAQGDPYLWKPIFQTNQKSIIRLIGKTEVELKRLKKALTSSDSVFLLKFLQKAAEKRSKINLK